MRLCLSTLLARLRDERGISLIEVMMSASLLTAVLGAVLSLGETTAKLAPADDERAAVMDQARTGMYSMTRELRQARSLGTVSSYSITATLTSGTVVTYTCNVAHPTISGRSICRRTVGSSSTTVVDQVVNQAQSTPVFTRTGNYVTVTLKVAAAGERTVGGHNSTLTLGDGFYVRNAT
jgi:Tfp pilus assembly protein PilW